jgi:peptidyl-prolyl cis-trans isomerase D
MSGAASVAFSMRVGDISGPIDSGANGAVLSLLEVQAPTDADFAAKRDQIWEQLLQSQREEIFGLFVNNVRVQMEKTGKIKVNQEEMKTLTRPESESGV